MAHENRQNSRGGGEHRMARIAHGQDGRMGQVVGGALDVEEEVGRKRSALLLDRQARLEGIMDEHDDLVRQAFHMEKFVTMLAYDPKVAKADVSAVFKDFKSDYDLIDKATVSSSPSRATRRSQTQRLSLLRGPADHVSTPSPSRPDRRKDSERPANDSFWNIWAATKGKGKGKERARDDAEPSTSLSPSKRPSKSKRDNQSVSLGRTRIFAREPISPDEDERSTYHHMNGTASSRVSAGRHKLFAEEEGASYGGSTSASAYGPRKRRKTETGPGEIGELNAMKAFGSPKALTNGRGAPRVSPRKDSLAHGDLRSPHYKLHAKDANFTPGARRMLESQSTGSPSTPLIKRVKLIVRAPAPSLSSPRQKPPPPQYGSSLPAFLSSYASIDGQDLSPKQLEERARRDASFQEKVHSLRSQGRLPFLDGLQLDLAGASCKKAHAGPRRGGDIWDSVVEAVVARGRTRRVTAPQVAAHVANKIQSYWEGQAAKQEKAKVQEEKRLRALAKATIRLVTSEWKKVVFHLREEERLRVEAEERRKGHEHLDAILNQSGQILETQQGDLSRRDGLFTRGGSRSSSASLALRDWSVGGDVSEDSSTEDESGGESGEEGEPGALGREPDSDDEVSMDGLAGENVLTSEDEGLDALAYPDSDDEDNAAAEIDQDEGGLRDLYHQPSFLERNIGESSQSPGEVVPADATLNTPPLTPGSSSRRDDADSVIAVQDLVTTLASSPLVSTPRIDLAVSRSLLATPLPPLLPFRDSDIISCDPVTKIHPLKSHVQPLSLAEDYAKLDEDADVVLSHKVDSRSVEISQLDLSREDTSAVDAPVTDGTLLSEEPSKRVNGNMDTKFGSRGSTDDEVSCAYDNVNLDQLTDEFVKSGDASRDQSPTDESLQNVTGDETLHEIPPYLRPYAVAPVKWDPEDKIKPPLLLRGVLRPYQQAGMEWLASLHTNHLNGILADEMGLGKTIQTIALLAHLACDRGIWGPHLIIVPTSVLLNWEMEFKKFMPGFKVLSYHGTTKRRKELRQGWNDKYHFNVCITSYTLASRDAHIFKRKAWYYMILDEAHMIKNFKSQRWNILLMFRSFRRLLLTGTPLQNNLTELWALLQFLMSGTNFANLKEFGEWFSNPLEKAIEMGEVLDDENMQRVSKLHTVLRPYLLRRLKRDVEKELPSKYEHLVLCSLSKRQRFLYDEFMSRAQTRDDLQSGIYHRVANILMQLRKVCNHPDLFEVRPVVTSFAMQRSAIADFEIKELLVRRRMRQCQDEVLNLEQLGLEFVGQQNTSSIAATETRRLDGSSHLPFIDELPGEPPPKDTRTIRGYKLWTAYQQRTRNITHWTHTAYLNSLRCHRIPVYSMEDINVARKCYTPLVPLSALDLSKRYLETPLTASTLIKSYDRRVSELTAVIDKFAFVTPAAIARDLPSIVFGNSAAFSEFEMTGLDAVLHQASVKLQVAFPEPSLLQYDCGKLQNLSRLLRERKAGGHRVLIFTQMTRILDILEIFLNFHGYLYLRLDGATKIEDRQYITERFNADPRVFCFIASSRSGGVGINLTGADTVIFYDSDFNPQMDRQCEDRAHRIGQIRDVHIYRFISEHTVEEALLKKANQKRSLDDIVIQKGEFDWRSLFSDEVALTQAMGEVEDMEDAHAAAVATREEIAMEGADAADFGGDADAERREVVKEKATEVDARSSATGLDDGMALEGGEEGPSQAMIEDGEEGGTTIDYMLAFARRDSCFFSDWRL